MADSAIAWLVNLYEGREGSVESSGADSEVMNEECNLPSDIGLAAFISMNEISYLAIGAFEPCLSFSGSR